jgi:hypothetical protein
MDQGENTLAAVLRAGKSACQENKHNKNDPDDEKSNDEIFAEDAHNGPAKEKSAQGKQKYGNFSFHRIGTITCTIVTQNSSEFHKEKQVVANS